MEALLEFIKSNFPSSNSVPDTLLIIIINIILAGILFGYMAVLALFLVWAERKVSARMQSRLGPMEVGGFQGWAQTIADAIKLLLKEDIVPKEAERMLYGLAPFLITASSLGCYVVIPFSRKWIVSDINIGILYILAISSMVVIAILMAGWSAGNKYSLFGGMRSAAQIVSYEAPVALSILTAIITIGSLSMSDIVEFQLNNITKWLIFRSPFLFLSFFIYFVASLAEVNRTPFDIPEAESELVAGYHTEYSGMRFAFFFLAEYSNMFIVSAIGTTLFLGGWSGILPGNFPGLPGIVWFLLKTMSLIFVQMWLRWTLPRLRVDQLMYMSWKVLLPLSFICLLGQGIWLLL